MAGCGITRERALTWLSECISNTNLIKHCLATEAIMRKLALDQERPGEEEVWAMTGLLHDLDYEKTENDFSRHGVETAGMLEGLLPDEAIRAIRSHNAENNGFARSTVFDHLLAASENLTGLITATALVQSDRKLSGVEPASVIRKMGKSGFARSVSRDCIRECEKAGYSLEDFVAISLEAMKEISDELGL
ncbi:HDIG domain-containing protein [Candidatus Fermentibacterales bacterium]|nr:HDIG domain-containing protein [Candidatus Fermentibacterales bacterium]